MLVFASSDLLLEDIKDRKDGHQECPDQMSQHACKIDPVDGAEGKGQAASQGHSSHHCPVGCS